MPKKTDKKTAAAAASSDLPFEQSFECLEEIVQRLEEGDLTLDESLRQYEQGVTLLRRCYQLLDHAEKKVETLVSVDETGEVTAPFETGGDE